MCTVGLSPLMPIVWASYLAQLCARAVISTMLFGTLETGTQVAQAGARWSLFRVKLHIAPFAISSLTRLRLEKEAEIDRKVLWKL